MGNCISSNLAVVGGSAHGVAQDSASPHGSPTARTMNRDDFRPYRPRLETQGEIWTGHWSSLLKPMGYVAYEDRIRRMPMRVRPYGFHLAVRRNSPTQRAITDAFAQLGDEGISEGGIRAVFEKGRFPERLPALLTLVDYRLLDVRRSHKYVIPNRNPDLPPVFEGHPNLVQRMALTGREAPEGDGGVSLFDRFIGLRRALISLRSVDAKGRAPIHYAVMLDNVDALRALIRLNVDLDVACKQGDTPLILAAKSGANRCINELLDAGANPNLRNLYDQFAPLHFAAFRKDESSLQTLRTLLEHKDNPAHASPQSHALRTPLHFAVQGESQAKVRILLRNGALPNLSSKKFGTPLHIACRNRDGDMIRQLLEGKAHPNLKDPDGKTALQLAIESRAPRHIIRLLQDYGAE